MIFFDDSITKERADRCVTHHHACDCREYACRQRIDKLQAQLSQTSLAAARLDTRIAALEAQEMGFVQSLCSQSEEIGRLKQRIAELEQMIAKFCACQNWATDAWKDQPHIKPLFDTAALLSGRDE